MPMQELGYEVSYTQLRKAREKCNPEREKQPKRPYWVPTDEMRVLIRAQSALTTAQLRVRFNKMFAKVRRAPRAPVRACAGAHPQAGRSGRGGCADAGTRV